MLGDEHVKAGMFLRQVARNTHRLITQMLEYMVHEGDTTKGLMRDIMNMYNRMTEREQMYYRAALSNMVMWYCDGGIRGFDSTDDAVFMALAQIVLICHLEGGVQACNRLGFNELRDFVAEFEEKTVNIFLKS